MVARFRCAHDLQPAGTPLAIALVGLELVLAWAYRGVFAPMLRLRVPPN